MSTKRFIMVSGTIASLLGSTLSAWAQQAYTNGLDLKLGDPSVAYVKSIGYFYGSSTGSFVPYNCDGSPSENGFNGTLTVYRSKSLPNLFHSTSYVQVPVFATPQAGSNAACKSNPNQVHGAVWAPYLYFDDEANVMYMYYTGSHCHREAERLRYLYCRRQIYNFSPGRARHIGAGCMVTHGRPVEGCRCIVAGI